MNITNDVNIKVRSSIMELNKPYEFMITIYSKNKQESFSIPKPMNSSELEVVGYPTVESEFPDVAITCDLFVNGEKMENITNYPPPSQSYTFDIQDTDIVNFLIQPLTVEGTGRINLIITFK